jgi:outer membrane protein assembly factor BamB
MANLISPILLVVKGTNLKDNLAVGFVAIAILSLSLFSTSTLKANAQRTSEDWPMFHDNPSHNGVGTGSPVLTPQLLWNFSTFGPAVSQAIGGATTPAVANGVLYVGDSRYIYALDAENGAELWRSDYGGVDSSPAVVRGTVYVGAGNFLYALSAENGSQLWNYTIFHGSSFDQSSPTVENGAVYIGSEGIFGGDIYALNATDGSLVWSTPIGVDVFSSPAVVNGVVYVGSLTFEADASNGVYALNATSGAILWKHLASDYAYGSSPAVVDDTVYIGSGNLTNIGQNNHAYLEALNAVNGDELWNYTTGGYVWSSPAVADGLVYAAAAFDGDFFALNAESGKLIWNFSVGEMTTSSPAVVDGVIYIGSSDKNVYALNAADGAKIWNFTTDGDVSSPVLSNDILYVCSSDNVYALGTSSLSPSPTVPSSPTPSPLPTLSTASVVVLAIAVVIVAASFYFLFKRWLKTETASSAP